MTDAPADDSDPARPPAISTSEVPEPYPEEVEVLEVGGRRLVLVGTAHVSQASVDLVRAVIERERPDVVCVELDQRRHDALVHKKRWETLDLREVIRKRQLATLLVNLVLSSYQKRLGDKLGVAPGSELLAAVELANERGVPVALCDRDVRITLRRAWAALGLWQRSMLLSGLLASLGKTPELSEADLAQLRRKDAMSELLRELGEAVPELTTALIHERDGYLAHKIGAAEGRTLVAVVGAGHLSGMSEALRVGRQVDLAELERIPERSSVGAIIGWGLTAAIVGGLVYIGLRDGVEAAGSGALTWALVTGVPSALGGLLSLAHPLTVLSAFLAAPITTLSPLIGAGHVTALVQAYLVPPRVYELQRVGDDIASPVAWWTNRLLRVLLVFVLTSLGAAIGAWVGGAKLLTSWLS
jgi:pheromone shutdown-related protein TraB